MRENRKSTYYVRVSNLWECPSAIIHACTDNRKECNCIIELFTKAAQPWKSASWVRRLRRRSVRLFRRIARLQKGVLSSVMTRKLAELHPCILQWFTYTHW